VVVACGVPVLCAGVIVGRNEGVFGIAVLLGTGENATVGVEGAGDCINGSWHVNKETKKNTAKML
jgi:hypothetical protein